MHANLSHLDHLNKMPINVLYIDGKSIYPENTDYSYNNNFGRLNLDGINLLPYKPSLINVKAHIFFGTSCRIIAHYISKLRPNKFFRPITAILTRMSRYIVLHPRALQDVDVIISYYIYPLQVAMRPAPLVFICGFPSNEYAGVSSDAERVPEVQTRLRVWKRPHVLLAAADDTLAKNFRRVASMVGDDPQTIGLPFFLPDLKPIDAASIDKKFEQVEKTGIRIAFVGRDSRRKGLPEVLEAMRTLLLGDLDQQFPFSLDVVGDIPPDFGDWDDINVNWHGFLDNSGALEILQDAHIFCMPTRHDSYGLVFLEAMASGCALITDNTEPRVSFCAKGRAGNAIPPGDPNTIASALRDMICDVPRTKAMAHASRQLFEKAYAPAVASSKLGAVIRAVYERRIIP